MGVSSLLRAALFDYRSECEEGDDCWACKQDDLHANAEGRAASCACVCVFVAAQRDTLHLVRSVIMSHSLLRRRIFFIFFIIHPLCISPT